MLKADLPYSWKKIIGGLSECLLPFIRRYCGAAQSPISQIAANYKGKEAAGMRVTAVSDNLAVG